MAAKPNDLDRLFSAWRGFQDLVNVQLPATTRALTYAKAKLASETKSGTGGGPKPLPL